MSLSEVGRVWWLGRRSRGGLTRGGNGATLALFPRASLSPVTLWEGKGILLVGGIVWHEASACLTGMVPVSFPRSKANRPAAYTEIQFVRNLRYMLPKRNSGFSTLLWLQEFV